MWKAISGTRDNESINIKRQSSYNTNLFSLLFPPISLRFVSVLLRLITNFDTERINHYRNNRVVSERSTIPFLFRDYFFISENPGWISKVKRVGGRGEISFTINLPIYFSPRRFNAKLETRRCLVTSRFPPLKNVAA